MWLRMTNLNILRVHWKIRFLGGLMKNQYKEGDCWKWGPWTFCWVKGKGAWQERGRCIWGERFNTSTPTTMNMHKSKGICHIFGFLLSDFYLFFSCSSFLCSSVSGCSWTALYVVNLNRKKYLRNVTVTR